MSLIKLFRAAFLFMFCSCIFSIAQANVWDTYKERFLQEDGSVIDTGNNNIVHSESLSYGLRFALFFNDKEAFAKIINWADTHLYDQKSGLYYWVYKKNEADPVADKNNAPDGDLMIAWSLIEAGKKWDNKEYLKKGERLASMIMSLNVTDFGGYTILMPGLYGFYYKTSVIVNPCYYIYPALNHIFAHTHQKKWKTLNLEGKRLLNNLQGQKIALAPDWIKLLENGENYPAEQWPSRSSYDAIRVPLYLYWENPNNKELAVWRDWFSRFDENNTPAWVDVVSLKTAEYAMPAGLKRVRDLVMGLPISEPVIYPQDDYYSASLSLLAYIAYRSNIEKR